MNKQTVSGRFAVGYYAVANHLWLPIALTFFVSVGCASAPEQLSDAGPPGPVECTSFEDCYDPTDCRDYGCKDGVCTRTLNEGKPVTCGNTQCTFQKDCTSSVNSATTCDPGDAGPKHDAACDPDGNCVAAGYYGVCAQHLPVK